MFGLSTRVTKYNKTLTTKIIQKLSSVTIIFCRANSLKDKLPHGLNTLWLESLFEDLYISS